MTDNKLRPVYYKQNNHDLWWYLEQGLITKIDTYNKAIDKLVDLLSHSQAFGLRMVLLHAYSPDCSIEDLYTRVSSEASHSDVLEEQLKHQLREAINCPTPFLAEKKMVERGIKESNETN